MAFSGLIKDTDSAGLPSVSYPLRVVTFTLFSTVLGWVLTTYMPQIPDLAWRFAAGFGIAMALILITVHVSNNRGDRMFAALCFAVGFVVGMWGMWLNTQFGGTIPTIDQVRASAEGLVYTPTLFGDTVEIRGYIFEMWIAVTVAVISMPLLASLAKPSPIGVRHNPFHVHGDFAQSFKPRLVLLPVLSFVIAGVAVYADQYVVQYELPLQLVIVPPLVIGLLYAKLHMPFIKALIVSVVGGIAAAVGFWLPWLYMTRGADGMFVFFKGMPQDILARVEAEAAGYTYVTEIAGTVTDYSPWAFEIWAGLTFAYLCFPLVVTLFRRIFYSLRPV